MTSPVPPGEFEARAAERVGALDEGEDESTGTIDLETFAAMFDLFRVSARITADLESNVYRPAGLTTAGFRVLFTVWVFGSLEPREIARLAGVSTAAVSGVVTTLERAGHVTKVRRSDDRRRLDVSPTDSGSALIAQVYRTQNRREQTVFAALDRDELAGFTDTLRRLLETPLD